MPFQRERHTHLSPPRYHPPCPYADLFFLLPFFFLGLVTEPDFIPSQAKPLDVISPPARTTRRPFALLPCQTRLD